MFIEFTILTFFFMLGTASLSLILYISIQHDQWLDMIFNWQDRLREWDLSGTKRGQFLAKIFGYCELCFSHFISFISFWVFLISMNIFYDITTSIFIYFVWYLIHVSFQTCLNLFFITKLFNK